MILSKIGDNNVEEASNKFNKEVGKSVKVTMEPGW